MEYLFKSCSDLPIFNFDIVHNSNDFKYLVVGYEGYGDIKIPEGAEERWKEIKAEWIELIDNNEISYYYQLILEVTYLQTRYEVSKILMYQIYSREMNEKTLDKYIVELERWDYIYDKEKDKLDEIQRLMNQHRASQNKLGIKKDELEKMAKSNDEDKNSLEKQAVILEQITGKNSIDTKTTSVKKWVEIQKLASEINEQRRKRNDR